MDERPHLEPGQCPGADYFERRDKEHSDEIRRVITEVIGDVPKYMRIAGDNRLWLWMVSALVAVDTGLIITALIMISKI